MTVPFRDLGAEYRELLPELDAAVQRVMASGRYLLGSELEAFEGAFAAHVGATECIGVGSGSDAIRLLLMAAGIGAGDEVVVPAHTFAATWLAVRQVGASPVAAECDPATFNMVADRVPEVLTSRTRAILAVHLYGQPADMDALAGLARRHGVALFADAAQAHGARHRGRKVGSLGDAAAWSFYPTKNLGSFGDGGAVTTADPELAARLRILRGPTSPGVGDAGWQATSSRLDEIQAAVLAVKLRHLDEWNDRRRATAARYLAGLAAGPVILPSVPTWAEPVWHQFVVRSPQRDALAAHLHATGVGTMVHYPVPPARYAIGTAGGPETTADRLAAEVLSLPVGPELGPDQVAEVIEAVLTFSG
jgi:dTDP-4-amino-4,6-dideoxygalactose transaminase